MLSLLRDRADYLKDGKYEKMKVVQKYMTKLMHEDLDGDKDLMRPTTAYIVF